MQITTKEIEPCRLLVNYEADAEQIVNKRSEVAAAFKKAPVKGFRPGHASIEAIKIVYRKQIDEALKRALAEDAYHDAIFDKQLKPFGPPKFNTLSLLNGKFNCEFELRVKPDFQIAPYSQMEIPKPPAERTEQELVETFIQSLRVENGEKITFSETDFVEKGDAIILDYDGSIDGDKVDSLSAQGELTVVGQNKITSFDDNLLGMIIGEKREFDIVAPSDSLPSLAGKTIHFTATLNMGSKIIPCALDDQLAIKIGKNNMEELRAALKEAAAHQNKQVFRNAMIQQVSSRLVDDNKFSVPDWMALSEAQYLVSNAKLEWKDLTNQDKEKYLEIAEKNVRLSLILERVREDEPEAQLSDQEVFEVIKNNLARTKSNTPIDEIISEMQRTGYMQILFTRIRDEYTYDFIIKNSKVIE